MKIKFCGAASGVTGSCHLISTENHKILLDCGQFQGGAEEEAENFKDFPFDPAEIECVVVSHAHIDHCGRLPLLYKTEQPFLSSIMPMIALSMFSIATIARFTRSEMLEVLDSDYMLLAESKGITGPKLILRHALRNALVPIITVLAPLIVDLMVGSLVIEKIFSIPGIGSLMVTAIQSNDYNVTISIAFIYSAMYIIMMLVVDVLYGIIDPRIRLAKDKA